MIKLKLFKVWKWTMDPILAALLVIAVIFFITFAAKITNKAEIFDKEKRQVDITNINKVCLDNGILTECLDIPSDVYKIYIYKEEDITAAHTVLITRK
jgi:uncharacterized protein YpmS